MGICQTISFIFLCKNAKLRIELLFTYSYILPEPGYENKVNGNR